MAHSLKPIFMAAKTLMIQGTASHVGKSVLVTGLCRLFVRRGLRVAPFKAQNMSNNSFVTPDGREIGRAQAVQATACRLAPRTDFNPVLIKPESDCRAQLVVDGQVAGSLAASDFGRIRREHFESVRQAFGRLASEFDLVILEGAGSPAEINLRDQDIVNMRMAREAAAPVLLIGDIDRGGAFASLVGTASLLEPDERRYLKGFLINKFRGDPDLMRPGIRTVVSLTTIPCLGIIPYANELRVPQEDSVAWEEWPEQNREGLGQEARDEKLLIGVADLPAISNFTDLEALASEPDLRLVKVRQENGQPFDALIIPGTKNTPEALRFIKNRGIDRMVRRVLGDGGAVLGICGGYQILGTRILDPHHVESAERELVGLCLLDVETSFERAKVTIEVTGVDPASGCPIGGYEVHMGRTTLGRQARPWLQVRSADDITPRSEGAVSVDGRVYGTYVHGLFDFPEFRRVVLNRLRAARGWPPIEARRDRALEETLDHLADFVAAHVDVGAIEAIIERGV